MIVCWLVAIFYFEESPRILLWDCQYVKAFYIIEKMNNGNAYDFNDEEKSKVINYVESNLKKEYRHLKKISRNKNQGIFDPIRESRNERKNDDYYDSENLNTADEKNKDENNEKKKNSVIVMFLFIKPKVNKLKMNMKILALKTRRNLFWSIKNLGKISAQFSAIKS
jgi:hypothetical protein